GQEQTPAPPRHARDVQAVAFSPDGKRVASASLDGTAQVCDSNTGKFQYAVAHVSGNPNGLAFSPDGQYLALSGEENTILLCDAATGKLLGAPWKGHAAPVNGITFDTSSKRLASAASDGKLRLWNAPDG